MSKEKYIRGLGNHQMVYLRKRMVKYSNSLSNPNMVYRKSNGDFGFSSTDEDVFKVIILNPYHEFRISDEGVLSFSRIFK